MCMAIGLKCKCGENYASIHNDGSILPEEVVKNLYCPKCAIDVGFDGNTMIEDNGWIIEYDMEIAKVFASNIGVDAKEITPEFLFDKGYCTWNGYTPFDQENRAREKMELLKLAREDRKRYIEEFKGWTERRLKRLSSEGWRKAKRAYQESLA